jgi:anthranilate synthase/aminodeoxychorismate synthase-like glutamine amidotransferase
LPESQLEGAAIWIVWPLRIFVFVHHPTFNRSRSVVKPNRAILIFKITRHAILMTMILVLDNYDSFTYNLVQYLGELGADLQVRRNDEISLDQIRALRPERILVSPGPCSPRESGLSNDVIRTFANEGVPIFGVCLGHQCIGHTFGAEVVVNYRMMHGKTSPIKHNGKDLFAGMPNPFLATRYHSLVIKRDTMPDVLEITAETGEGEIMGVKHKTLPIWGVQFHPESILTESGRTILKNFLKLK